MVVLGLCPYKPLYAEAKGRPFFPIPIGEVRNGTIKRKHHTYKKRKDSIYTI